MPRVKKVPLRMCVGCREMKPKRDLLRLVRTPQGTVEMDPTGKRSGRGAYVCPLEECMKKALKGRRFEKELGLPVGPQTWEGLMQKLTGDNA